MLPAPSVLDGPSSLKEPLVDRYFEPLSKLIRIFAPSGSYGFKPGSGRAVRVEAQLRGKRERLVR
jgi:hypothetical protein